MKPLQRGYKSTEDGSAPTDYIVFSIVLDLAESVAHGTVYNSLGVQFGVSGLSGSASHIPRKGLQKARHKVRIT